MSKWSLVRSGVTQGTKLGPWLLIIMVNELAIHDALLWKYVNDTTSSEVVAKGSC